MSATLTTPSLACCRCKGTGLVLAVVRDDDWPYYHAGLAYVACPRCDAGERLRAADRDHDLADDLDRMDVPCVGPVFTPRMVAREPMGLVASDLEV